MPITTVVFDLFSTLVYLEKDSRPFRRAFREIGLDEQQMQNAYRVIMTRRFASLDEVVRTIAPYAAIDLRPYEESLKQEIHSASFYPETMPVLQRLRDEGYAIGMISNLATPYKQAFFNLGLQNHIDTYLFSCDEGCKKPDPEVYYLLLRRMNINASETMMVGDTMRMDVLGPRGIGMNALLLDRSGKEQPSITTLDGVFDYL